MSSTWGDLRRDWGVRSSLTWWGGCVSAGCTTLLLPVAAVPCTHTNSDSASADPTAAPWPSGARSSLRRAGPFWALSFSPPYIQLCVCITFAYVTHLLSKPRREKSEGAFPTSSLSVLCSLSSSHHLQMREGKVPSCHPPACLSEARSALMAG